MTTLEILGIVAISLVGLMIVYNVFIAPFIRRSIERKKDEKLNQELASFKEGDKVLLASGMIGYFVKRKADIVYVEVAKDTVSKFDKHSIVGIYE